MGDIAIEWPRHYCPQKDKKRMTKYENSPKKMTIFT
jgi:hypothetical protein